MLLLALLASDLAVAIAEVPYPIFGHSTDLGFTFKAEGAQHWCGKDVRITLTISGQSQYQRNRAGLPTRLDRLRRAVVATCPSAVRIYFVGRIRGEVALNGYASRLDNWRYVDLDLKTQHAVCIDTNSGSAECLHLVEAYDLAHSIFDRPEFDAVRLSHFLSPGDADVEWSAAPVVGAIRYLDLGQLDLQGSDAATLAGVIAEAVAGKCAETAGTVGMVKTVKVGREVAMKGFECRRGTEAEVQNFVVYQRAEQTWLLSVGSLRADGAIQAAQMVDSIVRTISGF